MQKNMQKCMGKDEKMGMQMMGFMRKCNCMNSFVHCIYRNTREYGQIA
jgi:hypothetical protein